MSDRRRCNDCGRYRPVEETVLIGRRSGGNYRRPSTSKPTGICDDCVREHYPRIGPRLNYAVSTVDRWDRRGVIRRAVELSEPSCTVQLRRNGQPWVNTRGEPVICQHYAPDGDCRGVHGLDV